MESLQTTAVGATKFQDNLKELYASNQDKKYEIFNSWCEREGVKIPKLEYPTVFEGGLLGARVKEDIQHREAFLFIPFKMLMSLDYAHQHRVLGPILQ